MFLPHTQTPIPYPSTYPLPSAHPLSLCSSPTPPFLSQVYINASNLEDETLDVEDFVGGFKLGGFLLDVGIEYCTLDDSVCADDGNTVAAVFSETGWYEETGGNIGPDFDWDEDTWKTDFDLLVP